MKVLYAIQGTGNGHLSRAKEVIPALMSRCQVDILVSGTKSQVTLPYDIKYRLKGIPLARSKNGRINYFRTLLSVNIFRLIKEIRKVKVHEYDLVINDFEPISAWACIFKRMVHCVSLSHQCALLANTTPGPKRKSRFGIWFLKNYAPSTSKYGFHFQSYANWIHPPIIREDIRKQSVKQKKYHVVYLPTYSDEKIIQVLKRFRTEKWKVFSKNANSSYKKSNVQIQPICKKSFKRSMAWSRGIICSAGFEAPAEALYLRKKLMVIPTKGLEQQYNAAALESLGVDVCNSFDDSIILQIKKWLRKTNAVELEFPDKTQFIIDEIISNHIVATELSNKILQNI